MATIGIGSSNQGMSVALSADGTTAIVGAPGANDADRNKSLFAEPAGAAWVFTRSGESWSKRPNKLFGSSDDMAVDCGRKVRQSPCPPMGTPPS